MVTLLTHLPLQDTAHHGLSSLHKAQKTIILFYDCIVIKNNTNTNTHTHTHTSFSLFVFIYILSQGFISNEFALPENGYSIYAS